MINRDEDDEEQEIELVTTLRQNALFAKLLDHIRSREGYAEPQEE